MLIKQGIGEFFIYHYKDVKKYTHVSLEDIG